MKVNKYDKLSKALNESCAPIPDLEAFTPQVMRRIAEEKVFMRRKSRMPILEFLLFSPLFVFAPLIILALIFRKELMAFSQEILNTEAMTTLLSLGELKIFCIFGVVCIGCVGLLIASTNDHR